MSHWKEGAGRPKFRKSRNLYKRTQEAIEFLMEEDGYSPHTKKDFAYVMASRYGEGWLNVQGQPDHRLVGDVCTLTREQEGDPVARSICSGYVVSYSSHHGGLVLVDPDGDMSYQHQVKFLLGDSMRQKQHKTENRRRVTIWRAASKNAIATGDYDLGLIISSMAHEIETTGFISDSLIDEYVKALSARGLM